MLETQKNLDIKDTNGKAIGSLLIGVVSIIGIFLVGNGAIVSVAGLLLGIFGLVETKKVSQKGVKFALVGIILNSLGIVSLFS